MGDAEKTTILGGQPAAGMYPAAGYPGANGARPGQPERRRAWGWVALGLAALLVVGLATYLTSPRPERGVRRRWASRRWPTSPRRRPSSSWGPPA